MGPQVPVVPAPQVPQALQQPTQQAQHILQLNWSYFKPEFSGKPEDAEAHILRTKDWMDTHQFQEGVKVHRFYLTPVGEARLWFESLRHINVDWQGLQNQFRQQYSKNRQYKRAIISWWQSVNFDENAEILDAYVTHIRQVATHLGYGEPQILEVFKNTLPTK